MLVKVNESTVKSTEGYQIKLGRHTLFYYEDNEKNRVTVEIEDLMEPHRLLIYTKNALKHWDDKPNEVIDIEKKNQIIQRIKEMLNLLKIKYEIE